MLLPMKKGGYASVILETAIDKALDYEIPEKLTPTIRRGVKVTVPLRGRKETGYILQIKETPDFPKCREILSIHEKVSLTEELFDLGIWMARYYGAPLRKVFKTLLPAAIRKETAEKKQYVLLRGKTVEELRALTIEKREKRVAQAAVLELLLKENALFLTDVLERTGVSMSPIKTLEKEGAVKLDIVRVERSPLSGEEYFRTKPKKLTKEQQKALEAILAKENFAVHLLHGVTGSGKTEVYLQAIEQILQRGQSALFLVPEISLTTQMIERFRSRFEDNIALLHYRLSQGEKLDEWERIFSGRARVVIGPRSAVFSPAKNLGIVIVDEEHENSYKQTDESPYYNARDVAVMRGKIADCPVVLGSATPSLESFANAQKRKYQISTLNVRAEKSALPKTTIIDMNREYEKRKGYTIFSDALLSGIEKRAKIGEQSILFLNRRGYHTSLLCKKCKEVVKCSQCDLALTYHKGLNVLQCHLCHKAQNLSKQCPKCAEETIQFKGVGTEQVERALHAILPDIRTLRVDADTTRHKGSHKKLLRSFGSGKADVLIGTQMIAKGLHFPEVTLVGVLNCDSALNIPDFKSAENVFQLITQVSGRAGRGESPGEVLIQTALPDNQTIALASAQDYGSFAKQEMAVRELFGYPPFVNLVKIAFNGEEEKQVKALGEAFAKELQKILPYEVLPLTPSGYAKVQGRYRMHFLIKAKNVYETVRAYNHLLPQFASKKVRITLDVDPTSSYF